MDTTLSFFTHWLDRHGTEPMRTGHLLRLPGCPFERRKGVTASNRIKLGQWLAQRLGEVVLDVDGTEYVLTREHDPERRWPSWWRLVEA